MKAEEVREADHWHQLGCLKKEGVSRALKMIRGPDDQDRVRVFGKELTGDLWRAWSVTWCVR